MVTDPSWWRNFNSVFKHVILIKTDVTLRRIPHLPGDNMLHVSTAKIAMRVLDDHGVGIVMLDESAQDLDPHLENISGFQMRMKC